MITKDEYFKTIVTQKYLHLVLGACVPVAWMDKELRWYAIGLFIITLIVLRNTEKKTEAFEETLSSESIKF